MSYKMMLNAISFLFFLCVLCDLCGEPFMFCCVRKGIEVIDKLQNNITTNKSQLTHNFFGLSGSGFIIY